MEENGLEAPERPARHLVAAGRADAFKLTKKTGPDQYKRRGLPAPHRPGWQYVLPRPTGRA